MGRNLGPTQSVGRDTIVNIHIETTTDTKYDRDPIKLEPVASFSSSESKDARRISHSEKWSAI